MIHSKSKGTPKKVYGYRILGASAKTQIFKGAERCMEHKIQRPVDVIYHRVEILSGSPTVGTITTVVTAHCEIAADIHPKFINTLKK